MKLQGIHQNTDKKTVYFKYFFMFAIVVFNKAPLVAEAGHLSPHSET